MISKGFLKETIGVDLLSAHLSYIQTWLFICYNKLATSEYNRNKKLRLNKNLLRQEYSYRTFQDPQRHIYVCTLPPIEVWLLNTRNLTLTPV